MTERRLPVLVAKLEWHVGELVPQVGLIATNLNLPPERVIPA
jgi:hypothetical protein